MREVASIKWLGHSAFEIKIDGLTVLIDPWVTGNPKSPVKVEDLRADIVIVTHDHGDHGFDDAVEICKRTGATFVSIFELAQKASERGVRETVGMNIGGPALVKGLEIILTPALHSSESGNPTGVVIKGKELTIYHAGDTGVFSDMKLIGELYKPKIALLPVGGHFTMGPVEAAYATKLLGIKYVIPMHYGTFPVLKPDPSEFISKVRELSPETEVIVLKPGESHIP